MDLSNYKKRKVLKTGGKSGYVYLLENKRGERIIKKKYDKSNSDHYAHFRNEVRILKHLEDCDFVPKLLRIDECCGIIYMSYCGKPVEKAIKKGWISKYDAKNTVTNLMRILEKDWGVVRKEEGRNVYKIGLNNVCYKRGKGIQLIDFGSLLWKIERPLIRLDL